jgi:dinuclear metal center YbgI/SA1388 family protein
MSLICSEVIGKIEEKYPRYLAEDWDNVGLIIGDRQKTITKVLVCLDITDEVVDEAISGEIDMIISHHPLIFKPLKKIVSDNHVASLLMKLIRSEINVYSMHTNYDNAVDGMNDVLAEMLGLKQCKPLTSNKSQKLYKLVVFVPVSHQHHVRDAILNAGAGHIGNYSHCSFNACGTGTFKPLEGTKPFIGKQDELENVNEVRIETIVEEHSIGNVIKEMLRAHPYEEVAYDIYPLLNSIDYGTGRYGTLEGKMTFKDFCSTVKQRLNVSYLNVVGSLDKEIEKVAIVGGAGADFIKDAINKGCDVLITGDVKHHQALDALSMGINVIDAGHYFTEITAVPMIAKFLGSIDDIQTYESQIDTNPFKNI